MLNKNSCSHDWHVVANIKNKEHTYTIKWCDLCGDLKSIKIKNKSFLKTLLRKLGIK